MNNIFNAAGDLTDIGDSHAHPSIGTDQPDASESTSIACKVDPEAINLRVTQNERIDQSRGWATIDLRLAHFEQLFIKHRETERKDSAQAYLLGELQGDRRRKSAVSALDWLIIDLDRGEDISAVTALIKARGLYAIVHSTFSSGVGNAVLSVVGRAVRPQSCPATSSPGKKARREGGGAYPRQACHARG